MRHFPVISELLDGDDARIGRVLCAFRKEMGEDTRLLDDAMLRKDWGLVGVVARRAAMACHLLGEMRTGSRLETLANACGPSTEDPVAIRYAECVRDLFVELMARIPACVDEASCAGADGNDRT